MTDAATDIRNKNLYQQHSISIVSNRGQQGQVYAAKNTSNCIHAKSLSCISNTMHDTKNIANSSTATIAKEHQNIRRSVSFGKNSSQETSFGGGANIIIESAQMS